MSVAGFDTHEDVPHLLHRVQEHARTRPGAPALVHDGVVVATWADVVNRVDALVGSLRAAGVGDDDVVATLLPRGPAWVIGALAVWRVGAALLPLDTDWPAARKDEVVARARARAVLVPARPKSRPRTVVERSAQDRTADNDDDVAAVDVAAVVHDDGHPLVPRPSTATTDTTASFSSWQAAAAERVAWILFTSGSTGRPRGVVVPHRGYGAVLQAQVAALALSPDDRCAWLLATTFDASLSDVGVALWAGAALCTESRLLLGDLCALRAAFLRDGITYADLPPRLLSVLTPDELPSLGRVLVGGEPLPAAGAMRWARAVCLIGVYGPTEATICTSLWRVQEHDVDEAWIGAPVGGALLRVVDDELWIGGPGLALGYLDDDDLTAARFVVQEGRRWFRTGDLVRRHDDGRLSFVGRRDRQRKVDGRLVCPEEIEAALRALPGVVDAAVIVVGDGPGAHLRAHVSVDGAFDVDTVETIDGPVHPPGALHDARRADWNERLRARLPSWMVPAHLVVGPLPRNAHGKPDLAALTAVAQSRSAGESQTADGGDDDVLAAALAAVLPAASGVLGDDDDLPALGLDSLGFVALAAWLGAAGLPCAPDGLRAARTVGGVRALLRRAQDAEPAPTVAALQAQGQERVRRHRADEVVVGRRQAEPRGAVLVTGAAGNLGSRVVAALVDDDIDVVAIVRAADAGVARARLRRALERYGLADVVAPRIDVVAGDLRDLGIAGTGPLAHALLSRPWSSIVHLAARVDLSAPLAALLHDNVDATAGLLALTRQRPGADFLFASTLSVFVDGDEEPRAVGSDENPAGTARIGGGYAASKVMAEAIVQDATDVARLVVRYGLLVGDVRSGRAALADWFTSIVRGLARVGAVPDEGLDDACFDVTPVDAAARATVAAWALLRQRRAPARVHVAAPRTAPFSLLVDAFAAVGHRLAPLRPEEFLARVRAVLRAGVEPDVAAALLGLLRLARRTPLDTSLRPVDLCAATGWDFRAALDVNRGLPAMPAPSTTHLAMLVRTALQDKT
jgi:amino acid adenylation domain-containing protein/thioester reductase-like protein